MLYIKEKRYWKSIILVLLGLRILFLEAKTALSMFWAYCLA